MTTPTAATGRRKQKTQRKSDPKKAVVEALWYKDAVFYQLHVRAFSDVDGDGVGDFKGLTGKLDYLQDLGITTLWLLPFYPSPLKDEGYDISDYTNVHSLYGDLDDFRHFLREAHKRRLRVVTELVLNHTSDQHSWFQRARKSPPGSKLRDYYVWSDTPEKFEEARIIFKDFETSNWAWDPVAKAYYWHRFYSHQPDLNFDHPDVRKAAFQVIDFWFGLGVDGLRLDAVPYIIEREGTNCENLPETHQFLQELRRHIDRKFPGRMLLAEANQWPEDAVAYFGDGDECHMAFHFPIMPRIFMSVHKEDSFPIIDIMEQTPEIPETAQWATFLRNHDELTLEMVTDEERDYMYRVYADDPQARLNLGIRRRLAPLMKNHRRKIELMNGLLFSLPGTPIIYYGDEIGMGDNIYLGDRNGVRTPMQWNGDRNAGFSKANPQQLYSPVIIDPEFHYETLNVEAQQNNPHSLLWWTKRLIALRKDYQAFSRGTVEFLNSGNPKMLTFVRQYKEERVLIVVNLSRFVQYTELDLKKFSGMVPYELFGKTHFPAIGEMPYFLTLGPHSFYWFLLEEQKQPIVEQGLAYPVLPKLDVSGSWEALLQKGNCGALEKAFPQYLKTCRWFAGKKRRLKDAKVVEAIRSANGKSGVIFLFLEARYLEGESETYLLPVIFQPVSDVEAYQQSANGRMAIASVQIRGKNSSETGLLCDAVFDEKTCHTLFDLVARKRTLKGAHGELVGTSLLRLRQSWSRGSGIPNPRLLSAEQSNTTIVYGDHMALKLYRRLREERNPDLEVNLFLSERTDFSNIPQACGYLEYRKGRRAPVTVGLLQEWVTNQGDAWSYTLNQLGLYYERVLATPHQGAPHWNGQGFLSLSHQEIPQECKAILGEYLEHVTVLAERTANLHDALASDHEDPVFAPDALSFGDCRSMYQSIRNQIARTLSLLEAHRKGVETSVQEASNLLRNQKKKMLDKTERLIKQKIKGKKIRCHGDYHLGQVLFTGKDFYVLDFEGEPLRSVAERRLKRSPLKDVAGMIRSFHYAAYTVLWDEEARSALRTQDTQTLERWAGFWYCHVAAQFLRHYRATLSAKELLPEDPIQFKTLLDGYLLEKTLYEIDYEIKHRPSWMRLPLLGLLGLLEE